ncbi:AtpZ/AtpI family protein [Antarcticimicrobium luteum]|uniref:ATP synthase protein I n=1 Tax=Antarcticimicrobium luteum TaxID=2547397 RepID=A0A4R5V9Q9_9RHOB|nr:AtpZ/AtpI family protein [Antarcticimicrobium luteum]TDK48731.1 hypothetical protein E1832_09780 [Antarcticimicrobium luteum]
MTRGEGGADGLERTIARKARQHVRARREGRHTVWFGVGMFGLVGWAVAVPTLAGVALGRWLDARFADGPSWTIMGLLAGVALGSLNAWWWVRRTGLRQDYAADDVENDVKETGDDG